MTKRRKRFNRTGIVGIFQIFFLHSYQSIGAGWVSNRFVFWKAVEKENLLFRSGREAMDERDEGEHAERR